MEVPHLNLFVEENNPIDYCHRILSALRPHWNLSETRLKQFTDGITNKLFAFFNSRNENDVILIRIYGNKTNLLIDRKKEAENIKFLHLAGLAPALYATFDNGIVYEYLPGEVLDSTKCRSVIVSDLVARRLADLHCVKRNISTAEEPALWKIINKFLSFVPEKFSDPEKERRFNELFPTKPDFRTELSFLKRELIPLNDSIVFCHNDLLLGNVIHNSKSNSINFIDYEYADFNYQCYDIANHFNEFAGVEIVDYSLFPEDSFQRKWLRVYLEQYVKNLNGCEKARIVEDEVDKFFQRIQKFCLASHFIWGIWSFLQAEYSSIEFDFINYAFIRFREFYKRKREIFPSEPDF